MGFFIRFGHKRKLSLTFFCMYIKEARDLKAHGYSFCSGRKFEHFLWIFCAISG